MIRVGAAHARLIFMETSVPGPLSNPDSRIASQERSAGTRSEPGNLDVSDMLDSTNESFLAVDQNWRVTFANQFVLTRLGTTRSEVLGKDLWELTRDTIYAEFEEDYRRTMRERIGSSSEVCDPTTNTWYEVRVFPRTEGIGAHILNINERKTAEEIQVRLAAIVESSDDAIVSKDLNGIVRSWNSGAERVFGWTAQEIIGNHISVIAAPDRLDEMPNILRRIRSGERIEHYETKRKRKDGRIIDISLTVSPMFDRSGRIIGASKIARDISERKRMDEVVRATNIALCRANADLEQFAYSASHDLREPLRMIGIYSEMMKRYCGGNLDERANGYLRYIVEGAQRMEQLVTDLLEYTKAAKADSESPLVDASAAFQSILSQLSPLIEANHATVTFDALPEIRMHGVHAEQIFQNLVSNALKYRREEPPVVHVSAVKAPGEWIFSLQDNGIGIDQRYAEQIFGLFRRLHTSDKYPGTGVGLAICRNIVERYGGRIWVTSSPGEGSTFFFSIPRDADGLEQPSA